MIYQTGTITTTAGQTKIKGTGTRWKDNLNGISEGCPISYLINNVVYMNTILSVNSDTEINLTYPVPVAASAAKYQIATFVLDSMSDGVRKMLANQQYIQYFLRNMDTWLTQDGIVEIKTPTGETLKLESIIALKKLIDGKYDKSGGNVDGYVVANKYIQGVNEVASITNEDFLAMKTANESTGPSLVSKRKATKVFRNHLLPDASGTLMQVGDFGLGGTSSDGVITEGETGVINFIKTKPTQFWRNQNTDTKWVKPYSPSILMRVSDTFANINVSFQTGQITVSSGLVSQVESLYKVSTVYTTLNTTKDANGNLKAASPAIKVYSDHVELNDESEGVEMEHLGVGHYLIKGVIGFNADGAWGVNNGFVIPQDHNGKNMVLIDYEVRPDGDIEVFVFHQENAEMPERFQNKRIKCFNEEGKPVYFENYEPCDVPESRWIDMRVEMPPNSIYNQKLAEAERLAKIEAERVAKEETEKAAREEAEILEEESKQEQASKLEE
ncbi:TPA: hypothetical protein ACS714_003800 [Providencia alcalifaciens]